MDMILWYDEKLELDKCTMSLAWLLELIQPLALLA